MCGIAGIAGAGAAEEQKARATVGRMLTRMAHRGPDGRGQWEQADQRIALGHARLAILDISDAGRQPMHLGPLHSCVNGEIYNYPELRRELEEKYGASFASHCDSEIVLHGYRHEGLSFFARLNGMFAVALYDEEKQKLFLLRDRAGIKPLYYAERDGTFAFASEIKGLLAAFALSDWPIDREGLGEFLAYQTALEDRTLFKGVHLLPQGCLLEVETRAPHLSAPRKFYEAPRLMPIDSFDEACARYGEIFEQAVSRHLLSDVPVASYISAGFDSASVAAQAAHLSKEKLGAFTGRFEDQTAWYDETSVAAEAVAKFGGIHTAVDIGSDDFVKRLDEVIDALDEPKMGMGAFSQYMVAKKAAETYKVILTGHGGDELFSGYPVFKLASLRGLFSLKRAEIPHLVYFGLSAFWGLFRPEFGRLMPVLWPRRAQKKLLGAKTNPAPWRALQARQRGRSGLYEKLYDTYLNVYLPSLLIVEDKLSMAHHLESRTPMLDNAMLELSAALAPGVKLHRGVLKALIKRHARGLLPDNYFTQPKRGFPTPLRLWLRGPLRGFLAERLLGPQSLLPSLFDAAEIRRIVEKYEKSPWRHIRPLDEIQSHRMWQLLSLEAWLRVWKNKYGLTLRLE